MADRRGFFKELLREVAGVAQELNSLVQPPAEPEPELEPWQPSPPVPARPATPLLDAEASLLALCQDVGLEHRADDVRRAVRTSIRLTPADPAPGRSRLGGSPELPPGFEWPSWQGRELGFLAQIELAEVASVAPGLPLPDRGLLLFFYDLETLPSGLAADDGPSCRVVLVDADAELAEDDERAPAIHVLPVELSRELMLPSPWSFHAEQLELTAEEMEAWDQLRERLAQAQGVELEESVPDRIALHRLLGYQDEIGREVELDCELAAAGIDADDASAYWESRSEHEDAAREWLLLFQLSGDEELDTPRDEFERLFICAREADVRVGRFEAARAIRR